MPRITKQRKQEEILFLGEGNRARHNEQCNKCVHNCKQGYKVILVVCVKFTSKRAKQARHECV